MEQTTDKVGYGLSWYFQSKVPSGRLCLCGKLVATDLGLRLALTIIVGYTIGGAAADLSVPQGKSWEPEGLLLPQDGFQQQEDLHLHQVRGFLGCRAPSVQSLECYPVGLPMRSAVLSLRFLPLVWWKTQVVPHDEIRPMDKSTVLCVRYSGGGFGC